MSATQAGLEPDQRIRYVILRVEAPGLKRATPMQRLMHGGVNRAKRPSSCAAEGSEDESESSDNASSTSTSESLITPPASPSSHAPGLTVKDGDADSDGGRRVSHRTSRPARGRVFSPHRLGDVPFKDAYFEGKLSYYVRITLKDIPPVSKVSFKMFIDTGSNTTWVRRCNYRALLSKHGWIPRAKPAYWAKYFHPAVFGVPPEPDISKLEREAHQMEYDDGSKALLYQYPQDQRLRVKTILECEDYNDVSRWRSSITFHYQYALALAVDQGLEKDVDDGMIALGARRYQDCGDSPILAESFFEAITKLVPGPVHPEPDVPVMYFGLRPIPHNTPAEQEELYASFVTANGWPCAVTPPFSRSIRVLQSAYRLPAHERYDFWDVMLVGMQIRTLRDDGTWDVTAIPLLDHVGVQDAKTSQEDGNAQMHIDSGSSQPKTARTRTGGKVGTRVTLDTGASVSSLPMCAIDAIAQCFGGSRITIERKSGETFETYEIPVGTGHADREVTLQFGASSGEAVEIHVPALYFLYAPNPDRDGVLESLIEGQYEEEDDGYIFGVNFFHVAWIAMYKPVRGAPYVRMAKQGSSLEEVERYQLPTWEET